MSQIVRKPAVPRRKHFTEIVRLGKQPGRRRSLYGEGEGAKEAPGARIPLLGMAVSQTAGGRVWRDFKTLKELFSSKFEESFDQTKRHVVRAFIK